MRLRLFDSPVTVLMYHSIREPKGDPHQLAVSPDHFVDHVRYLAKTVDVIRLTDVNKRLRRPSVVLTFDDGYADNLHTALPILHHYGLPATFFVTTGTLGSVMWWDRLAAVFLGRADTAIDLSLELGGRPTRIRFVGPDRCREAMWAIYHRLKPLEPAEIDHVLGGLEEQFADVDAIAPAPRMMTRAELSSLARHELVELGGHTVCHERMAGRPPEDQVAAVSESRAFLESLTGAAVTTFAYPYGGWADVDNHALNAPASAGIELACMTVGGRIARVYDPRCVPRRMVLDWSVEQFADGLSRWRAGGP